MKIMGIVGSPRLGGNAETLTRVALEEAQKEGLDTELVSARYVMDKSRKVW
jgi:multimeric flavodoxin WrbA